MKQNKKSKTFTATVGLTPDEVKDFLEEANEDALLCDGLEGALVGIGYSFGRSPVAVYDTSLILDIFVKKDGMTYEEAWEFFEYNVLGAYCGEHMPIFVELHRRRKKL